MKQQGKASALIWSCLALILVIVNCAASLVGHSRSGDLEVTGVVVAVQPRQITIAGQDGNQVTLTTQKDLTQEAAVGSMVTASYSHSSGGDTLKSISYSLENFYVPAEKFRYKIKSFIVLPRSELPGADSLFDAIETYLHMNLRWRAKPRILAEELRSRHGDDRQGSSTLAAVDPATGQFDLSSYVRKGPGLIPFIADETRVNAVLEVDVIQVKAKVRDLVASWDNTSETLGEKHRDFLIFPILPLNGKVDAATVVMKLWDAQGRPLWSNRRGLAALAVLEGPKGYKLRDRPLSEVLQNPETMDQWLNSALGKLVSSDEEDMP